MDNLMIKPAAESQVDGQIADLLAVLRLMSGTQPSQALAELRAAFPDTVLERS